MKYVKVFFKAVKEYVVAMLAYFVMLGTSYFILYACFDAWHDFFTK